MTCHKEVEYGYLVNASVNEPDSFKEQFTKGKTNKINLITQYYKYGSFLFFAYLFFFEYDILILFIFGLL